MRSLALALTLAPCLILAAASTSRADTVSAERVQLAISQAKALPGEGNATLTVSGSAGRYDRLAATAIALPLDLKADVNPEAAGVKILKSELFLKAEGAGMDAARADTLAGSPPVKSIAKSEAFAITVAAQGPVAQNAFAACQAAARDGVRSVAMALPVVWRVTTGRSTFKWTNYDQVGPSDEMLNNRDFYGAHEVAELEASLSATVQCEALAGAAVAAAPAKATPAKPAVAVTPVSMPAPAPAPVTLTQKLNAEPVALTTAALPERSKPQCEGGMVRQVSNADAGFVCLCPGNTERIETAANAFTCEKRRSRR